MSDCTCADPQAVVQAINNQTKDRNSQTDSSATQLDETLYGSAYKKEAAAGASSSDDPGVHGAFGPIRFCRWATSEITGAGKTWWALATQAATLAIGILNGIYQSQIQDMQQDLAEGYYDQARYKWDRFNAVYRPLEQKLLDETSNTPIRELDCAGARTRARASVSSAYGSMMTWMSDRAKQLRLCVDSSLIDLVNHRRVVADVDTENYNLSDDQWYTDYKNDQRWNRRSNVLNIGRNLSSEVLGYGNLANELLGRIGPQFDRAAGAITSALGYFGARNDTYTPQTYLSTGGSGGIVNLGPTTIETSSAWSVPGSAGYGTSTLLERDL